MNDECGMNTNKEIWQKIKDNYYSPSIHITKNNNVGIDVGGTVFVLPIEEWHNLAKKHFSIINQTMLMLNEKDRRVNHVEVAGKRNH